MGGTEHEIPGLTRCCRRYPRTIGIQPLVAGAVHRQQPHREHQRSNEQGQQAECQAPLHGVDQPLDQRGKQEPAKGRAHGCYSQRQPAAAQKPARHQSGRRQWPQQHQAEGHAQQVNCRHLPDCGSQREQHETAGNGEDGASEQQSQGLAVYRHAQPG